MDHSCNPIKKNYGPGKIRPMFENTTSLQTQYLGYYVDELGEPTKRLDYYTDYIKERLAVEQAVNRGEAIIVNADEYADSGSHKRDTSAPGAFMEYNIDAASGDTAPGNGIVNIGYVDNFYAFITGVDLFKDVTITGTNDANAVKAFGDMMKGGGKFKVTKIHVVGTDDQSFSLSPSLINYSANGDGTTQAFPWPKTGPDANQSNVRVMEGADLRGLCFRGYNVLKVLVPKGKTLNISITGFWVMP